MLQTVKNSRLRRVRDANKIKGEGLYLNCASEVEGPKAPRASELQHVGHNHEFQTRHAGPVKNVEISN